MKKENLKFVPVSTMDEVLEFALNKKSVADFRLNMSDIGDTKTNVAGTIC